MASIAGCGDLVVISGANSAFIFNKKLNDLVTLDPPKSDEQEANNGNVPRKGETSMEHADKHMACVALSDCGQYLALASSKGKKSLFLWHLKDQTWTFISQRLMGRAASRIRFTQSSSAILVADKAGDVCSFSVTNPDQEKVWLLGHITMLLDVLVVENDKYVITCDRDDKIRVACFPNCYTIHSYCLGHTSFITSLTLLPHNNKFLISTSGDGTVKIWNYSEGKECLSIPVADYMEGTIDDPLPIKQCSALRVSPTSSLICVCIGGFRKCVVFQISGNEELSVQMQHLIETEDEEIWWSHFSEEKRLYLLKKSQSCPVDVLSWKDDFSVWQHEADVANAFKSQAQILQECFTSPSIPAMLYRKKFDEPPEKARKRK